MNASHLRRSRPARMGNTIALSDNGQRTEDSSLSHVLKGATRSTAEPAAAFSERPEARCKDVSIVASSVGPSAALHTLRRNAEVSSNVDGCSCSSFRAGARRAPAETFSRESRSGPARSPSSLPGGGGETLCPVRLRAARGAAIKSGRASSVSLRGFNPEELDQVGAF
jgi:hypothetical protein